MYDQIQESVRYIRSLISIESEIGLILGSGLGVVATNIEEGTIIPFEKVPNFPKSTVEGHKGELVFGRLNGRSVIVMNGRFHMYEGYDPELTAFPIRVMKELGVKTLIVTNAAGGLNPEYKPGDLMLISDHLNLTGRNPLIGPNESQVGVRFPDMSEPYSIRLREIIKKTAKEYGIPLREGVYTGVLGPSYETPAEVRMLRIIGGDAVGMSTVSEVIAANHAGIEVLGISCISNMASGIQESPLSHSEVVETTDRVKETFINLLLNLMSRLGNYGD